MNLTPIMIWSRFAPKCLDQVWLGDTRWCQADPAIDCQHCTAQNCENQCGKLKPCNVNACPVMTAP